MYVDHNDDSYIYRPIFKETNEIFNNKKYFTVILLR